MGPFFFAKHFQRILFPKKSFFHSFFQGEIGSDARFCLHYPLTLSKAIAFSYYF